MWHGYAIGLTRDRLVPWLSLRWLRRAAAARPRRCGYLSSKSGEHRRNVDQQVVMRARVRSREELRELGRR
jgi:hypothetical protein